ncbi:MAG: outer membrane protein transport protein [Myxococcales bacterium]|nr:outer membrane protein transport protein [Myxococcales bacterium]
MIPDPRRARSRRGARHGSGGRRFAGTTWAPILGLLGALLLPARAARAGGYEIPHQAAASAARGGTGTGRAGDPAAAWYCPAALADGGGLRLQVGVAGAASAIDARSNLDAPDAPWSASSVHGPSVLPQLHASYAHHRWALSVSFGLPYASRVHWAADWPHRFDAVRSELRFFRITPAFAYRFDRLRVSAGLHLNVGRIESFRATQHIVEEGSVQLRLGGVGLGVDLSAHYVFSDALSLGLSYKSRAAMTLRGDADFEVPEVFLARFPDQQASTEWTLPDRLAFGISARLREDLELLADVSLTFFSVHERTVIDFEAELTADSVIVNAWRDSVNLRIGFEWQAHRRFALRAGLSIDGLLGPVVPDERLSPSAPDATRIGLALGAGVPLVEGLELDLFYEHLRLLERSSTSADAPLATYLGRAHLFGLSLSLSLEAVASSSPDAEAGRGPSEPGSNPG